MLFEASQRARCGGASQQRRLKKNKSRVIHEFMSRLPGVPWSSCHLPFFLSFSRRPLRRSPSTTSQVSSTAPTSAYTSTVSARRSAQALQVTQRVRTPADASAAATAYMNAPVAPSFCSPVLYPASLAASTGAGFVIPRQRPLLASVDLPGFNPWDSFRQTALDDSAYEGE